MVRDMPEIDLKLNKRQQMAMKELLDPGTFRMLYGGSKGGGKSYFIVLFLLTYAKMLISELGLVPTPYPPIFAFIGRKRAVDFNTTTLETWKKVVPFQFYKIREQKKEITLFDRLRIAYGGLDDEENVQKFQSAEYAVICIDQAEEISRDEMALLQGTLRTKIKNVPLKYKILLTANPAICWLKEDFIDYRAPKDKFVQALPGDNEFLPDGYIDNLKDGWKHRPEMIKAYVDGNWDILAGDNIIIKPMWVKNAIEKKLPFNYKRRLVSCDPARYGDDETVIYVFEDGQLLDQVVMEQSDTMVIAGECIRLNNMYDCELIAVDTTGGLGAGVVDRLKELGQQHIEINYSSKASNEEKEQKYLNKRAEMYCEAADLFYRGEVSIPDDRILINQLSNVKYIVVDSRGKMKIEPKKDIKKRMSGKSPDRADAFVQGLWALQFLNRKSMDFERHDDVQENNNDLYGWNRNTGVRMFKRVSQPVGNDYGW